MVNISSFNRKVPWIIFVFLAEAGWIAAAPASDIHALVHHPLHEVDGSISLPPASLPRFRRNETGVFEINLPLQFTIPVTVIKTGNANRDSHMLEILQYPEFKNITVQIDRITAQDLTAGQYRIDGNILVAGKRQAIQSLATVELGGDGLRVRGEFSLSFSGLNLERPALLMMPVGDSILIRYRFELLPE